MHSSETEDLVHAHARADRAALREAAIGQTASKSSRFTAMEAELCGTTVASGNVETTISGEREALRGEPARSEKSHRSSYHALLAGCAGLPPLRVAVVDPCDADMLTSTVTAAEAGLIEPVLIGPAARICSVAALCHLDIRPFHLIGVDHDAAAEVASALAQTGKVEAIMSGSMDDGELTKALIETRCKPGPA